MITDIQSHGNDQIMLFLDHEQFRILPADFIFKFGLRIGLKVSHDTIVKLLQADEVMRAKNFAVNLLHEEQTYTKPKLVEELNRKGFSQEGINASIEDLERTGFIKDETFARKWIRRREKSKPRGRKMLRLELINKGIDLSTINQVLSNIDSNKELSTALRLAEKQVKRYKSLEPHVAKRRLHGFLTRRGFGYNTVEQVMQKVLSS
ncbi:TPA: RecX family transcriptional regulator [Candidatus Poribacteria bacterium]|jgi:regulatory protein|nr:RecX family transcriptional regulator [Candidatus Poribacteria bacterium]HIC00216.1 RecX family transcriptional regulator [Candidatus Poribacteria bacterium]